MGRSLLNQQVVSGWQSIGEYELDGRVNIRIQDNETLDSLWDGRDNARLALDAIRLVALSPGHTSETRRFDPQPSQEATTIQDARIRIPEILLPVYNAAAVTQCRSQAIDWTVVAAVASMESHHGTYSSNGPRAVLEDGTIVDAEMGEPSPILGVPLDGSVLPNGERILEIPVGEYAGRYGIPEDAIYLHAVGPFQFLPYEFERIADRHKLPGKDPQNFIDAAHAAAAKLCFDTELFADKKTRDSSRMSREALWNGIQRYNPSDYYVNEVLRRAEIYSGD